MSESVIHVFEILSNLGNIFRVCSGYVQSVFRVCSECVQSVFNIEVFSSSSASSVSIFGIFLLLSVNHQTFRLNVIKSMYNVVFSGTSSFKHISVRMP